MNELNKTFQYDNGLVLLFEEMNWSNSFAIEICVPSGAIWDPADRLGVAALTCEMTNRGAGQYDNREFLETLEYLGVDSSERANKQFATFKTRGLVDNWERSLELMALQIRNPRLSDDEFDECLQIQLQEIQGIEDEPKIKSGKALGAILSPDPWGRPVSGTMESVKELTIDDVRRFHQKFYRPNGAYIALAGRIDWEKAKAKVAELFGDWLPVDAGDYELKESTQSTIHIERDIAQTHISLGYSDVPFGHKDYWAASSGIDVLSGGMSSRLFTEVREKRGLCYTVHAGHYTYGDFGMIACYCGTTAENAQQSLEVIVNEFDKLGELPITDSEMERVRIRAKSAIVMQRESTLKRVSAMIGDWRMLHKVRSLEETLAIYDNLTKESVEEYYHSRPKPKFRLATVGPAPLHLDDSRLY